MTSALIEEGSTLRLSEGVAQIQGELGVRSLVITSYDLPKWFYETTKGLSAVSQARQLGCILTYAISCGRMGAKRRTKMDVDKLVEAWRKVIVGLAVAHTRDEADRMEAAVEELLTPILAAPIKQVREFYPKLAKALKSDPAVPFLVWRGYEVWSEQVLAKAADEEIVELKTDLAREIATLVEGDIQAQLPEALVRALQWRSSKRLEEVKEVVTREKAAGKRVRLRGRESCLFLEAGGSEEEPEVCVQI